MKKQRIILASTSPRRRELIATLGLPFEVRPSHTPEDTPEDYTPQQIVEELAYRKAKTVYDSYDSELAGAIVVGSDTIVVLGGEVLGKPKDEQDAYRMLSSLQGRIHEVYTGVTCISGEDGRVITRHRRTKVKMKPLEPDAIHAYIRTGEPSDKAGAYAIQGLGATFVDSIEGCYFNVVGLPLSLLSEQLAELGLNVLSIDE
ncbi:Maf family protein [Paenibacillus urinalis]|uniref:dTTP/UTP pyrophosphatase n=1 Tax=Paenibacillus urinalis TaxID=521520 RepID=A0AAX3MW42_9BACL|nr:MULTISPECIES: Maf family protein [Paenibacillus]WDH81815.1 Maf family protein [Paenibacillus urinalis]WDH97865.1 Maf family protein [Paenibacillus urinalis]WDI01541.1 Maf family protein [Paenibacillus urinalis]GAK43278.1 Maf-like protein [Paenibacillus sp. TCA20]